MIRNGEMLGVSPLRNRRVLSNGFTSLGKENLQLMYNDGDKAFGTSTDLCIEERMKIALDGIIIASVEFMRPQKAPSDSAADGKFESQALLTGKIRITTRCLWVDKGKLLEALQKAAHVALASCPPNCPIAHIERTISTVLTKVVRKYSSKRPEVVVMAMENISGISAKDLKLERSRKDHNLLGIFEDGAPKMTSLQGAKNSSLAASMTANFFYKSQQGISHVSPSVSSITLSNTSKVSDEKYAGLSQVLTETLDADSSVISPTKKHRKWKQHETLKLIEMRGNMDNRFKTEKVKILWEEISASLLEHGIDRGPDQCKSLWASLVTKYESLQQGEKSKKAWPYLAEMDKILSGQSRRV